MEKQIEEYFKEWSNKLSLSLEEIQNDFDNFLKEENEVHKDLTEDERKERALQRTSLYYKRLSKTPAVGFEGIIIGTGDCVDMVAKQRRMALELYRLNPREAISGGITDENGIPLETRREWSQGNPNPNFGKPLPEHNYIRNVFGVAIKKITNATPKFFTLTLSGSKAQDETIPIFEPVRFMANDKVKFSTDKMYVLNESTFTKFKVDKALNLPEYESMIKSICGDNFVELKDIIPYHVANKDNFNRLAITEGTVSSLNLEPTSFGSRIMTIEDEDSALEDINGAEGITCWIPNRTKIDFAEGSKVIVVGRTNQSKKKDDQGNLTEELGSVSMNVYGVYAIPKYKISIPEVEEVIEEDI